MIDTGTTVRSIVAALLLAAPVTSHADAPPVDWAFAALAGTRLAAGSCALRFERCKE